jgi:hypothetical protein
MMNVIQDGDGLVVTTVVSRIQALLVNVVSQLKESLLLGFFLLLLVVTHQ